MPEDLNQKISQFLDDELDHVHALKLLKKMQLQPEMQDKLNRYEAISHAIKTDIFLTVRSDLSARIHQQIQQEPFYLLPRHKAIKRSHKLLALAASIAIVAVIAERSMNNNPAEQLKAASTTLQAAQQQSPKPGFYAHQAEQPPLNTRINEYLQAHNSSVYTNGEANFQPFARVTAYSQK